MAVEFNVGFETSGDGEGLYLVRTLGDGREDREAVDRGTIDEIGEACKRNDVLRNPVLEKEIGELLFGVLNGDRQVLARALGEAEGMGERHPSVARDLNNLGFAYKSLGEVAKAIEFCEAAYGIWLEFFGGDHPHTQIAGRNLAMAKQAL